MAERADAKHYIEAFHEGFMAGLGALADKIILSDEPRQGRVLMQKLDFPLCNIAAVEAEARKFGTIIADSLSKGGEVSIKAIYTPHPPMYGWSQAGSEFTIYMRWLVDIVEE